MLALLCYIASQTLRGTLYIVFMLTLQHLLRKRLSPRVRAVLWAPLLFVLFAPNLCVVRVPVSQPVETTVVDALERSRLALALDKDAENGSPSLAVPASLNVSTPADDETVSPSSSSPTAPSDAERGAAPFASRFPKRPSSPPLPSLPSSPALPSPPSLPTLPPSFASNSSLPLFKDGSAADDDAEADDARLSEKIAPATSPPSEPSAPTLDRSTPTEPPASPLAAAPSTVEAPSERRARWFAFLQTVALAAIAIWALGLVVAFFYLVRSARVCRRWVRLSAPIDDDAVSTLYSRCADSLEIASPPSLATTTDLSSPALLGWRRAVVLIPSEYVDVLSEERLTHVLLHELGHYKRGDAATGFLAFLVLATHWFNPLFWLAARSFHAAREEACDAIALGSPALTSPNSAAEYARTLCEIAGRRPFVEQAFGAVGFSPTFRSLRRRVETLGRFGTWGRRAAIGCLVASLSAAAFATVRLLPDVEKLDAEQTAARRENARRLLARLPSPPSPPSDAVPTVYAVDADDPIAAAPLDADAETRRLDDADRLFFGHSTAERQAFAADAVEKLRTARQRGDAEYCAALGDYLVRESPFFWLLAGVDATVRDAASVPSLEIDAALERAETTADPNFRFLARLHRALADQAKLDAPNRRRVNWDEPLSAYVRSPFWRDQLSRRPCRTLERELNAGASFLLEAAAQGNGDAAATFARYIENGSVPPFAPSGFVSEIALRNEITERDLTSGAPDETRLKTAFLYALAGAEAGSARAQALVASYYARGCGVKRDVAEALRWGERFYEADLTTGDANYVPSVYYAKTLFDPATGRRSLVPKTLAELNVVEARDLRRLAPLVDVLSSPSADFSLASDAPSVPLSRRVFLDGGACDLGRNPSPVSGPKSWATFLLLAEAALDSEPTPENLELAEKFLRRANRFESRSFFIQDDARDERALSLDAEKLRGTPGFAETNRRLAETFASGAFGVKDATKASDFRRLAQNFALVQKNGTPIARVLRLSPENATLALAPSASAVAAPSVETPESPTETAVAAPSQPFAAPSQPFVAPQTPEFEATIAPIFAQLEKTLVDAKNGNDDALTARFNEYFDDATNLYPNGRPGNPEVARYKVERLTREIERLEQTDADAATLERLRESRDSWRRLAAETPAVAPNA